MNTPDLPADLVASALDQSPDPVIITDNTNGNGGPRILYVNYAFERLTGWTASEAVGQTPKILQGPKSDPSVLGKFRDAILAANPFVGETTNYTRDGREFLNRWTIKPFRGSDGHPTAWIGFLRNVTPIVEREARLQDAERRFRDLASNIPGAIFRYVIKPDGRDEIEYMSPGCLDIWELDSDAIQGDPARLWSMVDEADLPGMQASVTESAQTGAPWRHRWRITTPSGKRKWLHGRGRPTAMDNGDILFNSLILDISEQVAMQNALTASREQLHQAQKLEAMGQLTGGVAHDFNNLLAVVLGNLELLEEDPDSENRDAFIEDSLQAARRGRDLTRSLLSFARRAPLEPEPVELNATVREMDRLVRRVVSETISLEVSLLGGLWPVSVDRASLDSAILNLVINARDAMEGGGRLTIETANVRLDERYIADRNEDAKPGRYVMLAVTDTGVGIPPDKIAQVIEPFFTTKAIGAGSGLGLSMVQGFVKQSGGVLRIYSEVGVGTTVKLFFPASDARPEPMFERVTASRTVDPKGVRLLVAEDQPDVRRVIATRLQRNGFQVTTAANGDEALAIFHRHGPFDLLLTDVVMPGSLQGGQLAHALRETDPELSVVFMSGYPGEAAAHGNGLPADAPKLMKPVDAETLIRTIDETLAKRPDR
jgi:PAS domain S-box-containing protein